MENHRRYLEKLCRICGRKVTTGKGYWNAKDVGDYQDVMLQYFSMKRQKKVVMYLIRKYFFILLLI